MSIKPAPKNAAAIADLIGSVVAAAANDAPLSSAASPVPAAESAEEHSSRARGDHFNYAPKEQQ